MRTKAAAEINCIYVHHVQCVWKGGGYLCVEDEGWIDARVSVRVRMHARASCVGVCDGGRGQCMYVLCEHQYV